MITENQQVLLTTLGGVPGGPIAMPTDSNLDIDDIDLVSNPDVRVPNALLQSEEMLGKKKRIAVDSSMNVPVSFDLRKSQANTEKGVRLTS